MKFAKLYDTAELGQILVFVGFGHNAEPCMNVLLSLPDSPEIQHARTSYPLDTPMEEAIAGIQAMFDEVDEARAIELVTAYAAQNAGPFRPPATEGWTPIDMCVDAMLAEASVDVKHADGSITYGVDPGRIDLCAFGGVTHARSHKGFPAHMRGNEPENDLHYLLPHPPSRHCACPDCEPSFRDESFVSEGGDQD